MRGEGRLAGGGLMLYRVLNNVRNNPGCDSTLWLDSFTMASRVQLQLALSVLTWTRYNQVQASLLRNDIDTMDPGGDAASRQAFANRTAPRLRSAAGFNDLVALITQARDEWRTWFSVPANQERCYSMSGTPLSDIYRAFTTPQPSDTNIALTVEFIDLVHYPLWQAMGQSSPEKQLLNWVYMELFCRGSNYGAASDLLRIQLLIDFGGVYLDHDDGKLPGIPHD
jgi:hypothetical protein